MAMLGQSWWLLPSLPAKYRHLRYASTFHGMSVTQPWSYAGPKSVQAAWPRGWAVVLGGQSCRTMAAAPTHRRGSGGALWTSGAGFVGLTAARVTCRAVDVGTE